MKACTASNENWWFWTQTLFIADNSIYIILYFCCVSYDEGRFILQVYRWTYIIIHKSVSFSKFRHFSTTNLLPLFKTKVYTLNFLFKIRKFHTFGKRDFYVFYGFRMYITILSKNVLHCFKYGNTRIRCKKWIAIINVHSPLVRFFLFNAK